MPTKETLWFLLGRQAAGVFPRELEDADLIIPIFCKNTDEVSFILVKASNEDSNDWGFPQSALERLTPASVAQSNLIDNDGNDESYYLCLRGMCRSPKQNPEASLKYWPFLLSPKVSEQLAGIADPGVVGSIGNDPDGYESSLRK
ncbi:hypothetical protein JG688_00010648 [Phytophthora aleatoria]|uniref:Uncharacterized protein n=1 Tax=Phytophthora aleatoria TaxID=2496075 RepID=A0A8J5MFD9_9STRA|nr:hypothetical protein JG688_00010648 [Phytophthora aleatoria]